LWILRLLANYLDHYSAAAELLFGQVDILVSDEIDLDDIFTVVQTHRNVSDIGVIMELVGIDQLLPGGSGRWQSFVSLLGHIRPAFDGNPPDPSPDSMAQAAGLS
jgi:hypothetical protein